MPKRYKPKYGSLNQIQISYTEENVGDLSDLSAPGMFRKMADKFYSPDAISNTGPYKGIVLRVENSETQPGDWMSNWFGMGKLFEDKKPNLIKIKVRIPELHAMLPEPDTIGDASEDHDIIDMYPTFVAQSTDVPRPEENSLVWVDFGNKQNLTDPIYIKPVIQNETTIPDDGEAIGSAQNAFSDCGADLIADSPQGDIMSGQNKPLNHSGIPLLTRISSTFTNVLETVKGQRASIPVQKKWEKALKRKNILGKTWLGILKSNGASDTKHKEGKRSTIIFAPNTTDFSSPIELMYYFHGRAEFGNNYDFAKRYTSAIQKLIADKRNFVLVIPELPWCFNYKKIRGSTPIGASWAGSDNFGNFHTEIKTILNEVYSRETKINYVSITAHSQGGKAAYEALSDYPSININKITLGDATGWSGNKNWVMEIYNQYIRDNKEAELNVLVSVGGWLERTARRADKDINAENVRFEYISAGGGNAGHRKVGDLCMTYVNPRIEQELNEQAVSAIAPTTDEDISEQESPVAQVDMEIDNEKFNKLPMQSGGKMPMSQTAKTSPSAIPKTSNTKKGNPAIIKEAVPFKESRVRVSDYGEVQQKLLVDVPSVRGRKIKIHKLAAKRLAMMNQAWIAENPGQPEIKLASGHRPHRWKSKEEYNSMLLAKYGDIKKGKRFLAYASPHETGLAIDIGNNGLAPISKTNEKQKKTVLYKWLVANAHKFGFTPYKYEAWHWECRITKEAWETGNEFTDNVAVRVEQVGDGSEQKPKLENALAQKCTTRLGEMG